MVASRTFHYRSDTSFDVTRLGFAGSAVIRNNSRSMRHRRIRSCLLATAAVVLVAAGDLGGRARAEEPSTLEWDIFGDARWVELGEPMSPFLAEELGDYREVEYELRFGEKISPFEGKPVRIKGFMVPLEAAEEQRHFLLSKYPLAHCRYCQPGGSKTVIEVVAKDPVPFTFDAVTIVGKLEFLRDDPMTLMYRMVDAETDPR